MSIRSFPSKLAGVTFKNNDGSSRQDYIHALVSSGKPLVLKREPDNQYDSNAVPVFVRVKQANGEKDFQIGYLDGGTAEEIAPVLDSGTEVYCQVIDLTGYQEKNLGVNILLSIKEPDVLVPCKFCTAEIPDDSETCPKCGAVLVEREVKRNLTPLFDVLKILACIFIAFPILFVGLIYIVSRVTGEYTQWNQITNILNYWMGR